MWTVKLITNCGTLSGKFHSVKQLRSYMSLMLGNPYLHVYRTYLKFAPEEN